VAREREDADRPNPAGEEAVHVLHQKPRVFERAARAISLLLVAETVLLLVSAFRRVLLYEAAYGFTTARLYAQVYMVVLALLLVLLAVELRGRIALPPLLRRAAGLGLRSGRARLVEPRGLDRAAEPRARN